MCGSVEQRNYQSIVEVHYSHVSDGAKNETKQSAHRWVESRRVLTCSSNSVRDMRAVRYSRSTLQYCGAFGPKADTSWCLVVVVDGSDMATGQGGESRGSNCATVVAACKQCWCKRPTGRSSQNGNTTVCMKCRHAGA